MRAALLACVFFTWGGTAHARKLLITWTGDGNPSVPVCGKVMKSCKSGFSVTGGGVFVNLPITARSYTAANAKNIYYICVNGFNAKGVKISSVFETVPVK